MLKMLSMDWYMIFNDLQSNCIFITISYFSTVVCFNADFFIFLY